MALLPDLTTGAINKGDPEKQNESLIKQLNEWGRQISNEGITKIFKDDSGTQRVLLGKGSDGFQGIKVSQEGYDVDTAAEDELVMSSDFNSFKIIYTTTLEFPEVAAAGAGSSVTEVVQHDTGIATTNGLGIVAYLNYDFDPGGVYTMPYITPIIDTGSIVQSAGIKSWHNITGSISGGTFVLTAYAINYSTTTPIPSGKVRAYVLRETAS